MSQSHTALGHVTAPCLDQEDLAVEEQSPINTELFIYISYCVYLFIDSVIKSLTFVVNAY